MKTFTRDYRIRSDLPSSYMDYFKGMRPCVLDIETTGLSRENSRVILIGMLTEKDGCVRITQFLAENHYEEHKVLMAFNEFLNAEAADYLITYNGASFDVPFLKSRLEASFMEASIPYYHFDLYRFIKCGTDLKSRIGSLRQMSVENYYGILDDRNDTITGRESVAMFDEYSLTGNSTLEKIILTHNREDVLHLYRLMHLVLADADNDGDMHDSLARYGFPVMGGKYTLRPGIIKKGRGTASGCVLRINGDQNKDALSAAYFPDMDSPIVAEFNSSTRMLQIEAPVVRIPDSISDASGEFYLDTLSAHIDASDDTDCINSYLILNSRTVNLASRLLLERFVLQMQS